MSLSMHIGVMFYYQNIRNSHEMKPIKITPESIFQRNDVDFLFTEVDEETVLMNVKDNGYIGLNPVATDIWKILTKEKSLIKVVEDLMPKFFFRSTFSSFELISRSFSR